jgi:hypothetical protein
VTHSIHFTSPFLSLRCLTCFALQLLSLVFNHSPFYCSHGCRDFLKEQTLSPRMVANLLWRLLEYPYIVLAAIGGLLIPALEKVLDLNPSRNLIYFLLAHVLIKTLGGRINGIHFGLLVFLSEYSSFPPIPRSLFNLLGIWQVVFIISPMWKYITRLETDSSTIKSIGQIEMQLIFYYGPTFTIYLVSSLWSLNGLTVLVSIFLFWAFTTYHADEQYSHSGIISRWAIRILNIPNTYDIHIRGLFMHVCDGIIAPFDRWEIAIGQRRRDWDHKHSPLEPYQYCELKIFDISDYYG